MQNKYLKYSSMGFEMIATILIGLFLGSCLDKYFNTSKPYFSAFFSFIFVLIAIYRILASLLSDKNKE
jgi:F0F1-type ATP synthase assembly protein I